MKKIVRWSFRKKVRVVLNVINKELTEAQVCKMHDIFPDELREWITKYKKYGALSLKATNAQQFRSTECAQ